MELAWKDQNVVLFMTTVATGKESVLRERRRPAATATNARTSRAVFGEDVTKDPWIPQFIDAYNHFMNGIDLADQLRSYYNTQKTYRKTWKPLWHFLLDGQLLTPLLSTPPTLSNHGDPTGRITSTGSSAESSLLLLIIIPSV